MEKILSGTLDNDCTPGEKFDLILKNDNIQLASWIFNRQPLQYGTQTILKKKHAMHQVSNVHKIL